MTTIEIKRQIVEQMHRAATFKIDGVPSKFYRQPLTKTVRSLFNVIVNVKTDCIDLAARSQMRVSKNVIKLGLSHKSTGKEIRYEHVVPIKVIRNKLQSVKIVTDEFVELIWDWCEIVIVTDSERKLLDNAKSAGGLGLRDSMPHGWNGIDKMARFVAASIEI